jgi:hypothetical protein
MDFMHRAQRIQNVLERLGQNEGANFTRAERKVMNVFDAVSAAYRNRCNACLGKAAADRRLLPVLRLGTHQFPQLVPDKPMCARTTPKIREDAAASLKA